VSVATSRQPNSGLRVGGSAVGLPASGEVLSLKKLFFAKRTQSCSMFIEDFEKKISHFKANQSQFEPN
jgi:hypothetical protein